MPDTTTLPHPSSPSGPSASGPERPDAPRFASLGDRALAIALDTLVPMAAFVAAGMWLAPGIGGTTSSGFQLEGRPALIVIACALVAALVYQIGIEGAAGTSLGKIVAGARITTTDGQRIGFRAALVRNLMRFIDGLAVYLVAAVPFLLTQRRQRLGDLAAGTVVVCRDYGTVVRILALLVLFALPGFTLGALLWRGGSQAATVGSATEAPAPATATSPASDTTPAAASLPPSGVPQAGTVSDGPLKASNFRLTAGKDGPARTNATFKPGEHVALQFDAGGAAPKEGERGRLRLAYKVIDPEGTTMAESTSSEVDVSAAPDMMTNLYVDVPVPGFALPGTHRLEVILTDLVSGRHLSMARAFTVDALPFQPSDTLVLRNVRLTEGDDGPPRADTSYGRGGHLWVAFDIVGFKVGEGGAVKIWQDLEVVAADGTRVFKNHVLDIDERFDYLPRRLPASNHISIADMPAGDYQARLSFTDQIAGRDWTEVVRYTVRQ